MGRYAMKVDLGMLRQQPVGLGLVNGQVVQDDTESRVCMLGIPSLHLDLG